MAESMALRSWWPEAHSWERVPWEALVEGVGGGGGAVAIQAWLTKTREEGAARWGQGCVVKGYGERGRYFLTLSFRVPGLAVYFSLLNCTGSLSLPFGVAANI